MPRRFEIRTTAPTFEITAESAEHARDIVDRPRGPVRRAACPGTGGGTLPVRGGVRAGRLVLEMLAGPLPGIYDPTGPGRILFGFFAAMAETERENARSHPRRPRRRRRKGNHGGRPQVITDDMLHTVLRRQAAGEPVETIRTDLIIPTGKRKGHNPSLASIYRALAEHDKAHAYPEAIEQAHADFAALPSS